MKIADLHRLALENLERELQSRHFQPPIEIVTPAEARRRLALMTTDYRPVFTMLPAWAVLSGLCVCPLYGVTLDELTGRAPLPPPERKDT